MKPLDDLRELLDKHSVTELAKYLGVSRQTIYNWLSGRHGLTLKNIEKIVKNK